jgi:protein-L-isoaspartate O-methyltransferase
MAGGTQGYHRNAEALARQYESVSFEEVHSDTLHLIPKQSSRILDVGAGSGRDAAALAAMGHEVVAVEPSPELRHLAATLHPHAAIRWIDDSLPDLARVAALGKQFDLIMLTAVWMHLDAMERATAMERFPHLIAPSGVIIMSIRHGPVPNGRRMFDVPRQETPDLAQRHGLRVIHTSEREDRLGRRGIRWTVLALARPIECRGELA